MFNSLHISSVDLVSYIIKGFAITAIVLIKSIVMFATLDGLDKPIFLAKFGD